MQDQATKLRDMSDAQFVNTQYARVRIQAEQRVVYDTVVLMTRTDAQRVMSGECGKINDTNGPLAGIIGSITTPKTWLDYENVEITIDPDTTEKPHRIASPEDLPF